MIERNNNKLTITTQLKILGIPPSTYYYKSKKDNSIDDFYKKLILSIFIKYPFYGYRKIKKELAKLNHCLNGKKILQLMREMGIQAIFAGPKLSKSCAEHKKYPYLLRGLNIIRRNKVWATDITYIRCCGAFIYLVAILDLFSRKVLSWRISNTLDANFCIEALDEALLKFGKPEIFNTDQGSQFTSDEFTDRLIDNGIEISMDGKGRAIDNIYVERLWRSLKYEEIYLKEYENVAACKNGVRKYFKFYNSERFHQSLKYLTPDEIYFKNDKGYKIAS